MVSGGALAIVSCTVLQEELFHVLRRDPEITKVVMVQGERNVDNMASLTAALPDKQIISVHEDDLDKVDDDDFTVFLVMKTTSLHRNPDEFRADIIATARKMKPYAGSILLFYGLCRNALRKMRHISEEVGLPIMILTDIEGNEVDDCFGAVLGGKRRYLEHIKANHGTLFLITGYAEHWSSKLGSKDVVSAMQAYEDLRFVFDRCGYNRVIRLDTGLGDQQRFRKQVDIFVRTFDMDFRTEDCDLSVFEHSYDLAKGMLRGANKQEEGSGEEAPAVLNDAVPF
jgi:hypothetical protein